VKDLEKQYEELLDENKALFESLQIADQTTETLDKAVSGQTMAFGLLQQHHETVRNATGNAIGAMIVAQGGVAVVPIAVLEAMNGMVFKIKEQVTDDGMSVEMTIEEVDEDSQAGQQAEPVFEDDVSETEEG
jgi:hypothetical protein